MIDLIDYKTLLVVNSITDLKESYNEIQKAIKDLSNLHSFELESFIKICDNNFDLYESYEYYIELYVIELLKELDYTSNSAIHDCINLYGFLRDYMLYDNSIIESMNNTYENCHNNNMIQFIINYMPSDMTLGIIYYLNDLEFFDNTMIYDSYCYESLLIEMFDTMRDVFDTNYDYSNVYKVYKEYKEIIDNINDTDSLYLSVMFE